MITEKRIPYKPFEYEWARQFWLDARGATWLHTEVPMGQDKQDWLENLNENERCVIGAILKGFAQTETEVEDYWSTKITKWFPKPEFRLMAIEFAAQEGVHAEGYSYLNEELGLDNFAEFLEDEPTMTKLALLMGANEKAISNDPRDIARGLALFSICAEGIQLFSSFAILLSFKRKNRLVGIAQIIEWSVRDESLHSRGGCKLFNELVKEMPEIWDDELKGDIYEGVELALRNEFHYLNKVFENGNLESITKEQVKTFMYDRANRKLEEIGLKAKYAVDKQLLEEMSWFYPMVSGEQQTDFFAQRETGYSKPKEDWNNDDLF